jgi:hypothetical protein
MSLLKSKGWSIWKQSDYGKKPTNSVRRSVLFPFFRVCVLMHFASNQEAEAKKAAEVAEKEKRRREEAERLLKAEAEVIEAKYEQRSIHFYLLSSYASESGTQTQRRTCQASTARKG